MTALNDKITALENLLDAREKAIAKKINRTITGFAIAIVLALGYTTWAGNLIVGYLSPKNLSEQIQATMNEQIPQIREAFVKEAKTRAPTYIAQGFDQVIASVPFFEQYLSNSMDDMTNKVAVSIKTELMPAFTKFVKEQAPELKDKYKDLKDEEIGKAVTTIFLSIIEQELDKYFNDKFVTAVENLQKEIAAIRKPGGSLTRKQDAERRALMHWAYLAERQEIGKSVFYDMLQQAKQRFAYILEDLGHPQPIPEHEILPPSPK